MKIKYIFFPITTLCFLVACLFFSCKKNKNEAEKQVIAEDPYIRLKFIHASPNTPPVNLLIDDSIVTSNEISYPNATLGYMKLKSGTRKIKVLASGIQNFVINENGNFMGAKNYSLFTVNSLSKISILSVLDDLTEPASGKVHLRFINLSPDAGSLDLAITGNPALFPKTPFKNAKAFTQLNAGIYNFEVRTAGTNPPSVPALIQIQNLNLSAGKIYTIYTKGFFGGTNNQALSVKIIENN
jgi:hypothetical protein